MSTARDPAFSEPATGGVPAPIAPDGLPDAQAQSPARRSPQVRAAQLAGSRRPDLLPRRPATTP